jgi:hemolysin activation/secretion protein
VETDEGIYAGARAELAVAWGLNPLGTQLSGALKLEGGDGPAEYGRGLMEARLSRGLGSRTVVALSAATGSSAGTLPVQRQFFIGGPWAVHAHHPMDAAGDAFWTARGELARGFPMIRTTLFYDVGWAGARDELGSARWNARAGGIGLAMLDGLLRIDLSRRIDGPPRWGFDLYFDVR